MTEERLAEIEADHHGSYCRDRPCFAIELVAEVRRLQRQLGWLRQCGFELDYVRRVRALQNRKP